MKIQTNVPKTTEIKIFVKCNIFFIQKKQELTIENSFVKFHNIAKNIYFFSHQHCLTTPPKRIIINKTTVHSKLKVPYKFPSFHSSL